MVEKPGAGHEQDLNLSSSLTATPRLLSGFREMSPFCLNNGRDGRIAARFERWRRKKQRDETAK